VPSKVGGANAVTDGADFALGVHIPPHCRNRIDLGLARSGREGTDLAVKIVNLEVVEIGDAKLNDAQLRQGEQVRPAHARPRPAIATRDCSRRPCSTSVS
jgi:hypothetical protein